MNKATAYLSVVVCTVLLAAYGCREQQPSPQPVVTVEKHTFSKQGSVREMSIQPDELEFPEHPGKSEFISYCGICHSLKYITGQPAFPRKTWEAEVHKMVEKYGAPIDSEKSEQIVNYLMAINGTGE
jgi:sulfite dehydrogenase (cytochrome) subunit B